MENDRSDFKIIRDVVISVIVSFFLYFFGFGELIFVFPLLLISTQNGKGPSAIAIALETILVVLYSYFTRIEGSLSLPIALFELYIPLSLLAAGATWLISSKKSIGWRLFYAMLPSVLLFIILAVYLGRDTALYSSLYSYYQDVFEAMLSPLINIEALGEDVWDAFSSIMILMILSLLIPIVFCFVCATCFTFESVLHSRENDWEERVSLLELDGNLIWVLLATWLLVLLTRFISFPLIAVVALFNVTLTFTIVYGIQGFSVFFYRLRKKGRKLKSYTLFIILASIAVFVPGINILVVLGLPILGAIETFFELRR